MAQSAGDGCVVVDFYKTSCGACKYIARGFTKLCKASYAGTGPHIVYLKHNVFDDEDDESTDLSRRLRIQVRAPAVAGANAKAACCRSHASRATLAAA